MSIALIEQSTSAPTKFRLKLKSLRRPTRAPKKRHKISPRKLSANRKNAQKSTGPRTPQGKEKASQNSLKHGLCSQSPRLPNECGPTYNIFVEELREDLHPRNPIQLHVFDQLTSILWKLQRANDTEAQLYSLAQKPNDPPCLTLAKAFHKNPTSNPFLTYSRYERHLRNTYLRLLRELKNIQKQDAADAEHRRRTEPAWSPEKMQAQIERFNRQSQPNPEADTDTEDFDDTQEPGHTDQPHRPPDTQILGTDWYKEMTDRWRQRDKQRRLQAHREQNIRIEQQPTTLPATPSPNSPAPQTTNDTQPTDQNEPTQSHPIEPQSPSTASESPRYPLNAPNNFDETKPTPPATSPTSGDLPQNDSLQVSSLQVSSSPPSQIPLTSPPPPVKIPAETTSMLNSRFCIIFLLFSTFFLLSGCDKDENAADTRVSDNIHAARAAYYQKDGGPEKSHKLLEAAAKETAASSGSKATAKALVGQSNYALAISHLPEVNSAETEALRVIREINRIGSELGDEVFLIDSLKGSNPSASASDPLKALSANKAKFAAQVAELDKNIQQLETKRQDLTSKIASLDTEHKSKIEMGNALLQKSEQAQGQESVDLFKQSADVRKTASMLARDLEFARVDLARTQNLIADAQRERKSADDSVAIAQKQIEQLNQGWAATEDAIKKRRAEASNLLTRAEVETSARKGINAESGIAALAKQFAAAKQRATDARKAIDETNLEPSIAAYDEADKAAKKLMEQVKASLRDEKNKETPARAAWQRIERLYDPITYRLGKARSLQLRGQLFLQEKNLLKAQQSLLAALAPLFQRAGLTLPAELAQPDLAAQLDTAHKNAVRDLGDSFGLLKDILETDAVQRNTWPQSNEARELSVTVEYALHHLEPDKGHLDSARSTVKLLSDAGANFPALPPDLETRTINPVPIVAAGKAPTTNPAGANDAGPPVTPEAANALKDLLNRARGGAAAPKEGGAAPQPPPPANRNQ